MDLLTHINILDFTRLLPGPVATHLLAQMGAKVTKIESPKRPDYLRFMGSQIDGANVLFHQLNHNKEQLHIDYNQAAGKAQVVALVKASDVLIEQFRPGAMKAWGLGYEELKAINPQLIYVSVTGYNQEGDYKNEAGHDFNYLAYSGIMSLLKDDQGKPVVPGTQFSDIGGAYMIIIALQGALIRRANTGEGAYLNVPLANAVLPYLAFPYALHCSQLHHEQFNVLNGKTVANYAAYECADNKWISLAAVEMKFWNNFCDLVNKREWKTENPFTLFNNQFDKSQVEALFKTKTRDEWTAFFKDKDVCIAPILDIEELENSHFHQDSGTFEEFETVGGTKLKTIGVPFKLVNE